MKQVFNFNKFNSSLEKHIQPKDGISADHSGIANVIRYVWNHYSTESVDFDSFSEEDILIAISDFTNLPVNDEYSDDNDDVDETERLYKNMWNENTLIENVCALMHKYKNIVYENDDDFI